MGGVEVILAVGNAEKASAYMPEGPLLFLCSRGIDKD